MENIKASYETMFIVETVKGEEAVAAVVAKFKALIEANGEVESFNEWGKRKLAYPIRFKDSGYFVLMTFTAEGKAIAEIDRVARLTNEVIRTVITKA